MDVIPLKGLESYKEALTQLLISVVDEGASIGFLPPLSVGQANGYWQSVDEALGPHHRLFIATEQGEVLGTVQLALVAKPNGSHRAEIEKLMVHPDARGRGLAKQLMQYAERCAKEENRHLLVLDTRLGDAASYLYRQLGFIEAGQIPEFALNAEGGRDATVYFYKLLN